MPLRVLVIDDDDLTRDIVALLLNGAGYAVETADSGDAALLLLQTAPYPPEVVLTDLQMPGTSGTELARRLRPLCAPATTLLAMSASAPSDHAPEDQSAREFDGLLLKPFTVERFAAAISGGTPRVEKKSDTGTVAVLDENIYRKLAGSMRPPQVQKLYELCLADTETRLETIRRAASEGDDPTYKKEAHAIKGSCGMVGAIELQTLATSMERHGLSDDHVASLKEFMVACHRLRGMLVAREIIH
jgi:CheY-like chemotaxis protein